MDYEGFAKINVSFVIEKDGTMSAITVNDQAMSNSMKKSIERMLQSIKTKWSPAIIKDQPVRTEYELPLVFND
jgi:protein TonB